MQERASSRVRDPLAGRGELILIADADARARDALAHALAGNGYEIALCDSGDGALEAIRVRRPALVFADAALPPRGGAGLLATVRADPELATVAVIIEADAQEEESDRDALAAGADDYVSGPVLERELLARVKAAVAAGRLRTTARSAGRSEAARNRRLALIADISARLLLHGDPREQLKQAFDAVAHEIGADLYFNYLLAETRGQRLYLANSGGIDAATRARFAWIPVGRHLCGRVARQRSPLILSDLDKSTDPDAKAIRDLGGKCYTGFPLLAEGDLLGTIAFSSTARTAFADLDTELIATVASLFAAAIRRERLSSELRRSEARFAAIFNSATIGLAETDLAGTFKSVNDRFCAITGRSRAELLRRGVCWTSRTLMMSSPTSIGSTAPRERASRS